MTKKTELQLVPKSSSSPRPPRPLGKFGLALWRSIHGEYQVDDAGGVEMLAQACQALSRAEDCREIIDRDGELIKTTHGPKEHPLLKAELANRAFCIRTLQKLGLSFEPIRSVTGRPPGFA